MNNADLHSLLHLDPLLEAEKLTGKSYKEDDDTQWAGFGIMRAKSKAVEQELSERGDTTFRNQLDRYQEIITGYGFEKVLELDFNAAHDNKPEKFFVYWHPYGLLLHFDTYQTYEVNGGNVQYCWSSTAEDAWRYTSSSSPLGDGLILGSHDCREATIFNLENLRTHGEFICPWPKLPFMWLLHHGDIKVEGYDHKSITDERIAMLPEHVRRGLGLQI